MKSKDFANTWKAALTPFAPLLLRLWLNMIHSFTWQINTLRATQPYGQKKINYRRQMIYYLDDKRFETDEY